MEEIGIIVVLTKYMLVVTGVCSWSLRFIIPRPDEFARIFGIHVAPKWYQVFYNIVRWLSGNKSWDHKRRTVKTTVTEVRSSPEAKTTAKLEVTREEKTRVDPSEPNK
jgi:hypothetical protein